MVTLVEQLLQNSVGLLFVIISIGMLVGQVPFLGFRLGGSGVLLTALVFGHYGFILPKEIQTIGVVLFVYCVGLNAGPNILASLKKSKGNFLILSVLIVLSAGGLALVLKNLFHFPSDLISGIYAGAMTSTPALAAAMETLRSSTPSVGYGLAYPLGILGVILVVQFLPLIFRVNLAEEEEKFRAEFGSVKIERKAFKVGNPNVLSVTIQELVAQSESRYQLVRVKRGEDVFALRPDQKLEMGDIVLAVGVPKGLADLKIMLGEPVGDFIPQSDDAKSRWMIVSSKQFVGKKMGGMEISQLYGVIVTRLKRSGVEIVPHASFIFEAGDEIRVSGTPKDLRRFEEIVSKNPETVHETDIFSFAFGLAMGVLVGMVKIPFTNQLSIGLGIAGGPLIVGLLFGHFGRFGRVVGHMPKAARNIVGELGLYLFLAVAGCLAGENFVAILKEYGIMLILSGFFITIFPIIVATIAARLFFRMNLLSIMGMICGGMTSTPALAVITSNTKSDIPAISYASIYPSAVVFTTLVAQILALF